jgi:hypothetical protein
MNWFFEMWTALLGVIPALVLGLGGLIAMIFN